MLTEQITLLKRLLASHDGGRLLDGANDIGNTLARNDYDECIRLLDLLYQENIPLRETEVSEEFRRGFVRALRAVMDAFLGAEERKERVRDIPSEIHVRKHRALRLFFVEQQLQSKMANVRHAMRTCNRLAVILNAAAAGRSVEQGSEEFERIQKALRKRLADLELRAKKVMTIRKQSSLSLTEFFDP